MGPLAQVMEMLPGHMGQVARQVDPREAEDQLKQIEAVINSMTVEERRSPKILNASRRRRIARVWIEVRGQPGHETLPRDTAADKHPAKIRR